MCHSMDAISQFLRQSSLTIHWEASITFKMRTFYMGPSFPFGKILSNLVRRIHTWNYKKRGIPFTSTSYLLQSLEQLSFLAAHQTNQLQLAPCSTLSLAVHICKLVLHVSKAVHIYSWFSFILSKETHICSQFCKAAYMSTFFKAVHICS